MDAAVVSSPLGQRVLQAAAVYGDFAFGWQWRLGDGGSCTVGMWRRSRSPARAQAGAVAQAGPGG